jgi:hypothetical protein
MNTKRIIILINEGVKFGNHNTAFYVKGDLFIMCEFHKNCKYTTFSTIEKFAKRILKFYKIGY